MVRDFDVYRSGWDQIDAMRRFLNFRVLDALIRFRTPVFMACVFLQRSPMLNTIVERQFSLGPQSVHLLKWLTGVGTFVGGINAVTGATASVQLLKGYDNTQGTVGEEFRISFASSSYVVGSYRLGTTAPPGLALSPVVNEFGVGTIEGVPTQAGIYNADIFAYEEKGFKGDSTLLAITIYVFEKGPSIVEQPKSTSVMWGAPVMLSVGVQNETGVSYQWQRDGVDIVGANSHEYFVSRATSADEGLYTVAVTQDGDTKVSEGASVSVNSSSLEIWKEEVFEDPFANQADASEDPDMDGYTNFFEYSIGSNPEVFTSLQLPLVDREKSFMGEFVVYSYPKNPNATDLTMVAEYSDSLDNDNWTPVFDRLNGIRIVETIDSLVIKVPNDAACFIRFRLSIPNIN